MIHLRFMQHLAQRARANLLLHRLFFHLFEIVLIVVRLQRSELILLFLDHLFFNQPRARRIRRHRRYRLRQPEQALPAQARRSSCVRQTDR